MTIGLAALGVALTSMSSACCTHRFALDASLDAASKSYRRDHDLSSLQTLMTRLRLKMPEHDVVSFLGEPTYCPIDGQCYYGTDAYAANGYPFTLVVEYRYSVYRDDDISTVLTHQLESYSLFGVGE